MALDQSRDEPTVCVECILTWLMLGDGAVCLACRTEVYQRREAVNNVVDRRRKTNA